MCNICVQLEEMRFHACHGVMAQERVVGGDFTVSVKLFVTDAGAAVTDDRLEGTVNYASVYELVREQMALPSALIEHVAGRIGRALTARFKKIEKAVVTVRKVNPPMGADCSGAAVTLHVRRAAQPRVLILDFDGTVADTAAGIVDTMSETFRRIGLPVPEAGAVRQTIGLPLTESIARLSGLPCGRRVEEAVSVYREVFERIGARAACLFPGVKETLCHATGRGVTVAVATSRGHRSVESLCRRLDIDMFVAHYVAEDDVAEKKPHPEAVHRILHTTMARPEHALVVGDTSFDILMGRAAGCATCGVSYGNHSHQELLEAGAGCIVGSFGDLLDMLA